MIGEAYKLLQPIRVQGSSRARWSSVFKVKCSWLWPASVWLLILLLFATTKMLIGSGRFRGKSRLSRNVAQVKIFREETLTVVACALLSKTDGVESRRLCSYRGSSQSRAGTEGRPSPTSSPHTAPHGLQSRPP